MTRDGVLLAMALCVAQVVTAEPQAAPSGFPAAPPGYQWKKCPIIAGGLLVPTGWVWREEIGKNCSIARDSKGGGESAGHLVIAIIKEVRQHTGLKPSVMATQYIQMTAKANEVVRQWDGPQGPFHGFAIEYREPKTKAKPMHQYMLLIANDRTGSMFMTVGESVESAWPEAWKALEPVFKRLMIDDEL